MSSPYLKIGLICALFATVIGLAFYTLTPTEPTNDYRYNGLSQTPVPPPPPPAPMAPPPPPPPPPAPPAVDEDEFFKVVEEMPLFPGCDEVSNYEERRTCSNKKLMEYVYNNVNYPKEASKKGVEGVAVVSFKVSAAGEVYDEDLIRDPGAGTGEEALRVVRSMRENDIRWTPGQMRGKPVNVQFNLPVKFKLE